MKKSMQFSLLTNSIFGRYCRTETPDCLEKIPLGDAINSLFIYRSYPFEERNEKMPRAIIIIHGPDRNENDYFSTAMAAAVLADVTPAILAGPAKIHLPKEKSPGIAATGRTALNHSMPRNPLL